MKATQLLTTTALTVWMTLSTTAFDEGIVLGNNVNVRAKAFVTSEVVTQLQKGQRVVIIDEVSAQRAGPKDPQRWYMIALPSGTPVWVSAAFVENGLVTATRLNIRSGPSENHSVLGGINKGVAVSELRRQDKWVEIEAPGAIHGYVATFLLDVKQAEPTPPVITSVTPAEPLPPEVPVVPEPIVTAPVPVPDPIVEVVSVALAPVPAFEILPTAPDPAAGVSIAGLPISDSTAVFSTTTVTAPAATEPPVPDVSPDPLLTAPDTIVETEGDVTYRVINPNAPKKTWLGRWWQRVTTKKKSTPSEGSAGEGKFHDAPPPIEEGPTAVRSVTREGIVVRSWNIQAPSDWALKEVYTGRIVNYLWTTHTNVPWEELRGRTVRVTGEEAIDRRWQRTPVLRIETLKTLDDDVDG